MKTQIRIPFVFLRLFSLCILRAGFAFEIRGAHHLKSLKKPIILAGNHTGYLDSLILLASVHQPFYFLVRQEVFSWRLVGNLIRCGNILPIAINKPKQSLVQAMDILREGESICIFPEGQLSLDGQLGSFNEGTAFLQQKCKLPILPFAILGGFNAWPYGQKWPSFQKIVIQFGCPIWPTDTTNRFEQTQLLKTQVEQLIKKAMCKA